MTKKLEQCANCPAEIYQASDQVFYHLKTGNRWCAFGFVSSPSNLEKFAGKVAAPKMRPTSTIGQLVDVPGNGF